MIRRALIVGGGIGGLTAGLALQRAGIEAVVFEQAQGVEQIQAGGGLLIWPNGTRALGQIGLDSATMAVSDEIELTDFLSYRGALLARWPVFEAKRQVGFPTVGIARADLHRTIAQALPEGTLNLGAAYAGFVQDEHGVTLRLADGHEERGDVLIGADGLRSAMRTDVRGPVELRSPGYGGIQAVVDIRHELAPPGTFATLWGPGARFAFHHVGGGALYWFAVRNTNGADTGATRIESVRRYLSDWAEPTGAILAATDDSAITPMDVFDAEPSKRWGIGRVTLLGDAAHPMTPNLGQGTSQALEDAVVIARSLSTDSDPADALRAYEELRIRRTTPIVKLSRRLGAVGRWDSAPALAFRERFMKVGVARFGWKQALKMTSHDF